MGIDTGKKNATALSNRLRNGLRGGDRRLISPAFNSNP